jgi:5'-deoxynucleotidase YfbR-like HD superfamily hydrolase
MSANRLADLLRLTEIRRWGINWMSRTQSVAEHTFRVMAITMDLCEWLAKEYLGAEPIYMLDSLRWALVHDGPECFTGDIPATLKDQLNRAELRDIEEGACPWYYKESNLPDDQAVAIVDIADKIEAAWWAHCQCEDSGTYSMTVARLDKAVAEAVARYAWKKLPSFISVLVTQPPYRPGQMSQQRQSAAAQHPTSDPSGLTPEEQA